MASRLTGRICHALIALLIVMTVPHAVPDERPRGERQGRVIFDGRFGNQKVGQPPENLIVDGNNPARNVDPIMLAYQRFNGETLREAQRDVVAQYKALGAKGGRNYTPVIANFGPHIHDWHKWAMFLDGAQSETRFEHTAPDDPEILARQFLLNALETPLCMVGASNANRVLRQMKDNPQFYMMQAAQNYAQGHNLIVPYNLYDGSFSSRYYGRIEPHRPLYLFVRRMAAFLDGYEPLTTRAVVFPINRYPTSRSKALQQVVRESVETDLPTRFVPAGDTLPALHKGLFANGEAVEVLGAEEDYSREDWAVLKGVSAGRAPAEALFWAGNGVEPDKARDKARDKGPASRGGIWVFPRAHRSDPGKPIVLHVLNREHVFGENSKTQMVPVNKLKIRLTPALTRGHPVKKIVAHSVFGEPSELAVQKDGPDWVVELPGFRIWTILTIEAGDQTAHPCTPPRRFQSGERLAFRPSDVCLMRSGIREFKAGTLADHLVEKLVTPDGSFDEGRLIDLYGITCVSWPRRDVQALRRPGVRYYGSSNVGNYDLGRYPDEWGGWAQTPDGKILDRRGGKAFLSAAAPEYREYLLDRGTRQLEEWKSDGLMWDGTASYVGIVDYHPAATRRFKDYLAENLSSTELARAGVEDLDTFNFARHLEELPNPYFAITDWPKVGNVLRLQRIGDSEAEHKINHLRTPPLSIIGSTIEVDLVLRAAQPNAKGAGLSLYLLPGNGGSQFFSTVLLASGERGSTILGHAQNQTFSMSFDEWTRVRLRIDFQRQRVQVQINDNPPAPATDFRQAPSPGLKQSFCISMLKKDRTSDMLVRRFVVREVSGSAPSRE